MERELYAQYVSILKQELVPALGCTEPIAIAFGAAKAKELLGEFPHAIVVYCSGNIIKNVKSVTVPNSGSLKGVEASAILGAIGGDASLGLETLSTITEKDREAARTYLMQGLCKVQLLEGSDNLHIIIEMQGTQSNVLVEIVKAHTNIQRMEKNGKTIYRNANAAESGQPCLYSRLSLEGIFDFMKEVALDDVRGLLDLQIDDNLKIAAEGLEHDWGANVGRTLREQLGDAVAILAKALPAAGSDARMSGCGLPVVINSGSGNQGLTASLPVLAYASSLACTKERLYRALVLSNLVAIYQKSLLGKLSAYCGVVSAAAGAGAGIAYLHDSSRQIIEATIINTLANVSGIVCDGAKASCAAKIASAVDAALTAFFLARNEYRFRCGDGLVQDTADATIHTIGRLGRVGMKETDLEIYRIMLGR